MLLIWIQTSKNGCSHQSSQQASQLMRWQRWKGKRQEHCQEKTPKNKLNYIQILPHPRTVFGHLFICSPLYPASSLSTRFAASFSPRRPAPPPSRSDSFCQFLSLPPWADRQRQGDCCCACSLTLSAHKSLSTACVSPLLSSLLPPPTASEGLEEPTDLPVKTGKTTQTHTDRWIDLNWNPVLKLYDLHASVSFSLPVSFSFGQCLPADSRHWQALPVVGGKHLGNKATLHNSPKEKKAGKG